MQSERKRERAERTTLTYKVCFGAQNLFAPSTVCTLSYISCVAQSLVSDITDEAEQLDGKVQQLDGEVRQLQRSYKELRETTFRACR